MAEGRTLPGRLRLSLVDTRRAVVVFRGDKEVFRGVPKADLGTLAKTWLTGDPKLAFALRVRLSP